MKTFFFLFNHVPTPGQEKEARASFEVEQFVSTPEEIKKIWSKIPPELEELSSHLKPVCSWLESEAEDGDCILIQGDFGATFLMVEFARKHGLVPVYSTTERVAIEKHGGDETVELTHQFRHVRFREYGI